MNDVRKMMYMALFSTVAIVLSYVERLIPIPYPLPGLKLGLANIAILSAMILLGFKSSFLVAITKSLLSALILSRASAILYSFPATIAATLVMGFVLYVINKKKEYFSEIGVSVLGSVFFNITQIVIASFVINDGKLLRLIPYMSILSVITGIFIGYSSKFLTESVLKNKIWKEG